jgi:hypothetical protein
MSYKSRLFLYQARVTGRLRRLTSHVRKVIAERAAAAVHGEGWEGAAQVVQTPAFCWKHESKGLGQAKEARHAPSRAVSPKPLLPPLGAPQFKQWEGDRGVDQLKVHQGQAVTTRDCHRGVERARSPALSLPPSSDRPGASQLFVALVSTPRGRLPRFPTSNLGLIAPCVPSHR